MEKFLKDEPAETGEDETELIGPEDILVTKSHGEPSSSTASSILDERQYDREMSSTNYQREIFPCTEQRNVFDGTSV